VFVAEDARRGSTKQVASALGEGAAALLMARHHSRSWKTCPRKRSPPPDSMRAAAPV
jgi:hypothetical protein